ncbi:plasmolipin-like [Diceros bicornis minor]|uniref:plasmolipin-like n=1 Tax=Diceros bicornis minor TaxID=77932 RepID=UPI0026F02698|nr:plasmolipin-like [Diceros bicornis minor]
MDDSSLLPDPTAFPYRLFIFEFVSGWRVRTEEGAGRAGSRFIAGAPHSRLDQIHKLRGPRSIGIVGPGMGQMLEAGQGPFPALVLKLPSPFSWAAQRKPLLESDVLAVVPNSVQGFVFKFVFGGLVWILIASSLVPFPLTQGWVMFVSVFCFISTAVLFLSYTIGGHYEETSWVTLEAAYHSIATVFYLSAAVLEGLAAISMHSGFMQEHYLENAFATVFASLATRLYVEHTWFSLIRWKWFSLRRKRTLAENPDSVN